MSGGYRRGYIPETLLTVRSFSQLHRELFMQILWLKPLPFNDVDFQSSGRTK